jgi:hypothetical protein
MSTNVNTNMMDSNTPIIHVNANMNITPPPLVLKLQPNPTSQYSAPT